MNVNGKTCAIERQDDVPNRSRKRTRSSEGTCTNLEEIKSNVEKDVSMEAVADKLKEVDERMKAFLDGELKKAESVASNLESQLKVALDKREEFKNVLNQWESNIENLKVKKIPKKGESSKLQGDEIVKFLKSIEGFLKHHAQSSSTTSGSLSEGNENYIAEIFVSLDPPIFTGDPNPIEADNWVMTIEKIFNVIECPDEKKVDLAVLKIKGSADYWWEMIKRTRIQQNEVVTWEKFRELFYEKYFPKHIRNQKRHEFLRLVQGKKTVAQYEAKFVELERFAHEIVLDEVMRAMKFQEGLKPEIRLEISVFELKTFAEVVNRASMVEDFQTRPAFRY